MSMVQALTTRHRLGFTLLFCLLATGCSTNPIPQYDNPSVHPFHMSELAVASYGSNFKSFYEALLISNENYVRSGPVLNGENEIADEILYRYEKAEDVDYSSARDWEYSLSSATSSMRDAIVHAFRGFCTNNDGDMDLYQKSESGREVTPSFSDSTPTGQGNTATFLRCVVSDETEHYVLFDSRRGWGNQWDGKAFVGLIRYQDHTF